MPVFCEVDDKRVPLYRIVWISELPHFCGDEECQREGQYEIHLDTEESVWGSLARARRRGSRPGGLAARRRRSARRAAGRTTITKDAVAMSTFENDHYHWRETYFVLFPSARRPALEKVHERLSALSSRYTIENPAADEQGMFESLTVISPDDFAALDVCYTGGEEVLEHSQELSQELAATIDPTQKPLLKRIKEFDGRFDVLHFEQVEAADEDDGDDLLDPSALLAVMEDLARLTDGIAVDPQSGTIFNTEE